MTNVRCTFVDGRWHCWCHNTVRNDNIWEWWIYVIENKGPLRQDCIQSTSPKAYNNANFCKLFLRLNNILLILKSATLTFDCIALMSQTGWGSWQCLCVADGCTKSGLIIRREGLLLSLSRLIGATLVRHIHSYLHCASHTAVKNRYVN